MAHDWTPADEAIASRRMTTARISPFDHPLPDAEAEALAEIAAILETWPERDRTRIMRYLVERFGV